MMLILIIFTLISIVSVTSLGYLSLKSDKVLIYYLIYLIFSTSGLLFFLLSTYNPPYISIFYYFLIEAFVSPYLGITLRRKIKNKKPKVSVKIFDELVDLGFQKKIGPILFPKKFLVPTLEESLEFLKNTYGFCILKNDRADFWRYSLKISREGYEAELIDNLLVKKSSKDIDIKLFFIRYMCSYSKSYVTENIYLKGPEDR